MGNLGAFHGCGAEGASLEGKRGPQSPGRYCCLIIPSASKGLPADGTFQQHLLGALLPDRRMWDPRGTAVVGEGVDRQPPA